MSRVHAVEVVLTRPATAEERDTLDDRWTGRYAFSSDLRRATTVITAETTTDALDEAWNRSAAAFGWWHRQGTGEEGARPAFHQDRDEGTDSGAMEMVMGCDDLGFRWLRGRTALHRLL